VSIGTKSTTPTLSKIPRVALRKHEARLAIGVSAGTLEAWTKAGFIPHIRRGAIVLYPVDKLKKFLAEEADRQATERVKNQ
jgi:predicted site-specific integrase-resolvase